MIRSHRAHASPGRRARRIFIALAVAAGAIVVWAQAQPANSATTSVLQDCQAAQAFAGRTQADLDWLAQCVHALTPPTSSPTSTPSPTATPTATSSSPTPTPSSMPTACLPKPSACGLPDATNTGVPAGTVLVAKTGDMTVSVAGTVVQNLDLVGCITVSASNVVIRNSRIRCAGAYGIHNDDRNSATNLVIQNVEVDCLGTGGSTAIAGHNFAVSGANLHGCENGLAMDDNTSVVASWIHGLALVGSGHTDGIQSGGKGVTIKGNTIVNDTNGGTSTIITDPTTTANFVISGNLLSNDGGSYVLYCPKSGGGFAVTGNRLAWAHDFGYDYNGQCGASWVTWLGNVADSTGAALAP